jgi:hypothetical protein
MSRRLPPHRYRQALKAGLPVQRRSRASASADTATEALSSVITLSLANPSFYGLGAPLWIGS